MIVAAIIMLGLLLIVKVVADSITLSEKQSQDHAREMKQMDLDAK